MKQLIYLFLLLKIGVLDAQTKTITGRVSDNNGPLPGVSIIIKGSTKGTDTNFDGKYVIQVQLGDILVYNYLGYKTVEKTVGAATVINVVMKESSEVLEEVVVTAYGSSRKVKYSGASILSTIGDQPKSRTKKKR